MFKDVIKSAMIKGIGKGNLMFRKHGSSAMMWAGVGGVAATVVIACVATTKAEPVLDTARERLDAAKKIEDENEKKKAIGMAYGRTMIDFGKLYMPSAVVGSLSVGMIVGSHYILKKENVALMATSAALAASFGEYRKRVVEEMGEDKDKEYYYGVVPTTNIPFDADGTQEKAETTYVRTKPSVSMYSRFFDETNPNFQKDGSRNLMFLRQCQDELNYTLKTRGYIFLNEVYSKLGIPRCQAGQFVGWVYGTHDSKIDFGIYDSGDQKKIDFVNGFERAVLLDFNVDGDIMYVLRPKNSEADAEKEEELVKKYLQEEG